MSAELLLSISILLVMNPAMVIVTTRASSFGWWIPLASSSLNEITWSSIFTFFRGLCVTRML
jgi:hypothetical protein